MGRTCFLKVSGMAVNSIWERGEPRHGQHAQVEGTFSLSPDVATVRMEVALGTIATARNGYRDNRLLSLFCLPSQLSPKLPRSPNYAHVRA